MENIKIAYIVQCHINPHQINRLIMQLIDENTDVYIQVSRTEAMGLSIAEALSYGVPALVTQTTTMGDIIQEYNAGWSCNANVNSIAETFEKTINERDLYLEKSKNAVKLAKENYGWGKCVDKLVKDYNNLIVEG